MKKINIKNEKLKYIFGYVFRILNRLAPYLEILLLWWCCDLTYNTSKKGVMILLYIIPIFLTYRLVKYEYKCIASRQIIKDTALNKRVQGFGGFQGCGKTSFMLYSMYVLNAKNYYTNFPCKIRGKYTKKLNNEILQLDNAVQENSVLGVSEATLFFHNLLTNYKNKNELDNLFGQELHQQIIRHAYNGNLFYDSIDLTRMPQALRENIGLTNYMLGQHSKTFSFILTPLLSLIAKPFGIELHGNMRIWDVQQFEKIPENNYTFDLSNQEKDTNIKNYANLIEFCTWDSVNYFEYDDRFLHGLYEKLPLNNSKLWETLKFSDSDLRDIGYGYLIDFFNKKTFTH